MSNPSDDVRSRLASALRRLADWLLEEQSENAQEWCGAVVTMPAPVLDPVGVLEYDAGPFAIEEDDFDWSSRGVCRGGYGLYL